MDHQSAIKILGLLASFTPEELKHAYRTLAHIHHPDKGGNAEEFKKVNAAYQYLRSTPQKTAPAVPAGYAWTVVRYGFSGTAATTNWQGFYSSM